jgi:predicted enzyme related to lactoylglutathione lyase
VRVGEPASAVSGVDFVSIPTKDFDRAVQFYETVLGLECAKRYGRVPGAEFDTGNLTLQLLESSAVGLEFRPNAHPIALHVEDVEATRAVLESRGVEFRSATIDSGVCLMAPFVDPDGNQLMLHHRYAPRSAD